MPKYRIIYAKSKGDPCCWQLQKRKWFFFWENVYLTFASATTAANEMLELMKNNK